MKFKIKVCEKGNEKKFWWEEYDKEVDNIRNWAEVTIVEFNNSLRPWEKERILLEVQPMKRKERECETCYGSGQVPKGFLPKTLLYFGQVECPTCEGSGIEEYWE